jgi:hypothetical protein
MTNPTDPTSNDADRTLSTGEAAYARFLGRAMALPPAAVVPFKSDTTLIFQNVQEGQSHVLAERARLAKLPETDVTAIEQLGILCQALTFAAVAADHPVPSGAVLTQIARANALVRLLLKGADALGEAGVIPAAEVEPLHHGRGSFAVAEHLISLVQLFKSHAAAIAGKTAVTQEQLDEANALGTELLQVLKTRAAPHAAGAQDPAVIRDRFFTLVTQGYDSLWRAGAYLFGKDGVAAKVPALQAHRAPTAHARPGTKPGTPAAAVTKPATVVKL